MPVGVKPGHNTEHAIRGSTFARSWYSDSVCATTACLLTLYTPIKPGAINPAIDATLTICPSYAGSFLAASSISGVKARTP